MDFMKNEGHFANNLCFDRSAFVKDNFKVDQFVAECRNRVQLEVLRQDLESYFKLLKNEMIFLINKDYADFVNLSSNLVGMDKAILQLREPLKLIQSYVTSLRDEIESRKSEFGGCLTLEQNLSSRQAKLSHMMGLLKAVEKVEQISTLEETSESDGQNLERLASEFNQLQYHASFCENLPVLNHARPRIAEITSSLQQNLEYFLLKGIRDNDTPLIHRCFNAYALISKNKDAEHLVQIQIVRPILQQIIEEQGKDISTKALKHFFDKILDEVSEYIKPLCDVTSGRCQSLGKQYRGVSGYDVMVNAVWPELTSTMEAHMTTVFSPANPDIFHKNYNICMNFISAFEIQCRSQASVKRLRQSDAFIRFLEHWSLPVYFQIRFHEIGRKVELALLSGTNKNTDETEPDFRLHGSVEVYKCVLICWDKKVYLQPLLHRFWKLTLQCLSRFHKWITTLLNEGFEDIPKPTLTQQVSLLHDISVLNDKVNHFFESNIIQKALAVGLENSDKQKESVDSMLKMYGELERTIADEVVSTMASQSCAHLKQVQDIPRLYRRTNREAPQKPSVYVSSMMRPALKFKEDNSEFVGNDKLLMVLNQFFMQITDRYCSVVSDVLMSVRKMEESLQRLQKMRSRTSVPDASVDVGKLSDDDKIRLQLNLDMKDFGEQMAHIGVQETEIPKYLELKEVVEASMKKKTAS